MLEAAVAAVNEAGLSVGLDHISFEDVVRDARVSRSTAYRRWPYKDLFLGDLLRELAKASSPAAIAGEAASVALVQGILREHADSLMTLDGRHQVLLELLRRGSAHDFELMRGSVEWRSYLALHATFLGVADDDLRSDLQAALAESEQSFIAKIAASWQRLSALLGYRLRPEVGISFEGFARLASADLRGHVLMALASPDDATRPIVSRPVGASTAAGWMPVGIAIAGLAAVCFEPDPGVTWDDGRTAMVRDAVDSLGSAAHPGT